MADERAILSSLEAETERIQTHLHANPRSFGWMLPVIDPKPLIHVHSLRETRPQDKEAEMRNRKRQAKYLAAMFLRNPIKIVDLEDIPRILREGLLSRRRRGCATILDMMKGHENTIHLACGLPYRCRFDPVLDLNGGNPKAIVSFWGEALWTRRDFAISITDTGVLFRENNLFSQWIRAMNCRYKQIYGTQMHPSRLAINTISTSTKLLTATRERMDRIYRDTMLDLPQAMAHLTSLLREYFPFTGNYTGWLSEAWVQPGLLPEVRVSNVVNPSGIKAVYCSEADVRFVEKELRRFPHPIIPIADSEGVPARIEFSNVIQAYGVAVKALPSLVRYRNWLKTPN